MISIHAPLAGRDEMRQYAVIVLLDFNPRAPCGARLVQEDVIRQNWISIHAPLAGRDGNLPFLILNNTKFQSTRPLRGATPFGFNCNFTGSEFQSTRPLRGATFNQLSSL